MHSLPKFDESSANVCFHSFVGNAVLPDSLNALSSIFEMPLNAYSLVYPTESIPQNVSLESVNLKSSSTALKFSKFRDGRKIYYKAIDPVKEYDCMVFNEFSYLIIKVGNMVALVYFSYRGCRSVEKYFELEISNKYWLNLQPFFYPGMIYVRLNAEGMQLKRYKTINEPYRVGILKKSDKQLYTAWFADVKFKDFVSVSEYNINEVISLAYSAYLQYIGT